MRFGSLFSGIGGFDLGLERAGMECAWQVEINPFCQKVLKKHWSNVTRYEDVRTVGKHNLEPVDLIAGGFPCQPHSLAGKRRGAEDDRNLWPEYLRVIRELQPAWVIGENVPGIITTILDNILSDLESENYQTRTIIVPACSFGAPHIRERVFVIARRMADTEGGRRGLCISEDVGQADRESNAPGNGGEILADSSIARSRRLPVFERGSQQESVDPDGSRENLVHAQSKRLSNRYAQSGTDAQEKGLARGFERSNWWAVEPELGRVANGIPARVDRLRTLGNAVVPQVAEWIGKQIISIDLS